MSKPYFSILVPVFNQNGKMDKCVDSIKGQTFADFEVIFVDDGSTDGSFSMLEEYVRGDERFSAYRHEENRSLLSARYTGMRHAAGEYILFLDSDDSLDLDTLETLRAHIAQDPADVIRFGFVTDPGSYHMSPPESENPLRDFMECRIPPQITKNCIAARVVKKAVESVTPFYCNSGEDTFMSGTLFTFAKSFSRLDRCFYHYAITGGMSRAKESLNMAKLDRVLQSLNNCTDNLTAFMEKYNPDYAPLCAKACGMMYRYEICHFLLNADDERMLIDFLNRFDDKRSADAYDYGCREVVPEYYKRRLGVYAGDKMRFNAF